MFAATHTAYNMCGKTIVREKIQSNSHVRILLIIAFFTIFASNFRKLERNYRNNGKLIEIFMETQLRSLAGLHVSNN
jgi:hypothetical protein